MADGARRVVVAVHSERGSPGLLEAPLVRAGIAIELWRPYAGEPAPAPGTLDGLVVMGGIMNPDDDATHPWLGDERALMAGAIERDVPLLGVCLGAQLLAQVAGGTAPAIEPMELGWQAVELLPAAADDRLLGGLPARVTSFQWHRYACAPPASAVRLATSAAAEQAFRVEDVAWGVQFHPEVDRERVRRWAEHGAETLAREATTPEEMDRQSGVFEDGQRLLARRIGEGFAALVLARA